MPPPRNDLQPMYGRQRRSPLTRISTPDTSGVTTMNVMFDGASAFDQSAGADADVAPDRLPIPNPTPCPVLLTNYVMTNSNIKTAVAAWLSDATAAEATYGHISTWETSGVTDMSFVLRQGPIRRALAKLSRCVLQ